MNDAHEAFAAAITARAEAERRELDAKLAYGAAVNAYYDEFGESE